LAFLWALIALNSLALLAGFFWQGMRYEDLLQPTVDFKDRFADVNRHIDGKLALLSQQMKTMEDNTLSWNGSRRKLANKRT
jgi:hypothetical protein